eukprot:1548062-Prymnesium_polylepis.1
MEGGEAKSAWRALYRGSWVRGRGGARRAARLRRGRLRVGTLQKSAAAHPLPEEPRERRDRLPLPLAAHGARRHLSRRAARVAARRHIAPRDRLDAALWRLGPGERHALVGRGATDLLLQPVEQRVEPGELPRATRTDAWE